VYVWWVLCRVRLLRTVASSRGYDRAASAQCRHVKLLCNGYPSCSVNLCFDQDQINHKEGFSLSLPSQVEILTYCNIIKFISKFYHLIEN